MAVSRLKESSTATMTEPVIEEKRHLRQNIEHFNAAVERDALLAEGREAEREIEEELITEYPIKELIADAGSLDELCEVLSSLHEIKGSHIYTSRDVIANIRELQEFFESHAKELMVSVINNSGSYYQDLFGKKLNAITRGGDLNIRTKVKNILVAEMNQRFETEREELVAQAISEVRNFAQLFDIIEKFKGLNIEPKEARAKTAPRYSPPQAIEVILGAQNQLRAMFNGDQIIHHDLVSQRAVIDDLLRQWRVPHDSGIYEKVEALLIEELKEMSLRREAEKLNQGFVSKLGSRWRGFFRR